VVSPPPNLTLVSGTVLARRPHETLSDWDLVSLSVDATSPVPGMRDLVGPSILRTASRHDGPGDVRAEVAIAVRRELLGAVEPGWHLSCRVKFTPNGPIAEPHPAGRDFTVRPA
jgi:hypothetical protein